ncbi:acetyl-CoA synthetase-like protein [Ganoderma leucocontextum]|nr:acetyl-CoA synthetase-like protein [Ganoderma leucocontextum]
MAFSPGAYISPRSFIESGKATVPELFEWHARENTSIDVFRFYTGHGVDRLTYGDLNKAVHRAARLVSSIVGLENHDRHVIAVLASADTITYATVLLGILRAGHVAFPVSPRNSAPAVADLLRKTKCTHILLSQEAHISGVVQDALTELDGVSQHGMPRFEYLYSVEASQKDCAAGENLETPTYDPDSPALILHSSGSTNHPKPITWSHRGLIAWSMSQRKSARLDRCAHRIPQCPDVPRHGSAAIIVGAGSGWVLCVFPPAFPPTVPNPENVFDGAIKTGVQFMYTVPSFIELWSRDPEKFAAMTRMKGLVFGGAPLNKGVGDMLAAQGMSLITAYGSTEVGAVSAGIGADPGMEWEYFTLNYMVDAFMRPVGDGTYELFILSTSRCPPRVINDNVNGIDAYATNDLLEPHPTRQGLWKVYGRVDDQIMLSNGEKTNPAPLEFIIAKDPHVHGCLFFGRGKLQNGVLIEPTREEQYDPRDERKLADFRNKIWPTIESANAIAPQHSRIFKEMIMVTSPSKPFTYNAKGFPRRAPILRDYENEIEALYEVVDQSAQADIPPPSSWEKEDVKGFLRTAVQQILGRSLPEDADLFRNGCDSLQATYIRNTLLRALRDYSPAAAKKLPMNVMFQAPSISALTDAVLRALSDGSHVESTASTPEDLVRLVERYSANLPARPASLRPREATKDVVVVTGTTGGFGCDILEHLLRDDEIATVFAFNRKGTDALARQRSRFRERGHDVGLLDLPKFRMVEADLQTVDFGLEGALLEEIRASITHILHNAWQVNFNLKVSSFEGNLLGVQHLLEFALSSPYVVPPKVMFVSSIGVLANHRTTPPEISVSEDRVESSSAIGTGYAESKWVVEEILHQVADKANVPTTTVRLGQVSGDKLGHWNEKEWFPAVVKSAVFTRCLPGDMNEVAFILSYPAARAFVEMRKSSARTLHLVHPRPVAWKAIIAPIAQELDVPLVPYSEWLAALERGAAEGSTDEVDAMRVNPALRLLDFFRAQGAARSETGGSYQAVRLASEELARMPELKAEDAERWVAAWRASGFLPAAK